MFLTSQNVGNVSFFVLLVLSIGKIHNCVFSKLASGPCGQTRRTDASGTQYDGVFEHVAPSRAYSSISPLWFQLISEEVIFVCEH